MTAQSSGRHAGADTRGDEKLISTLQARAALAGFELVRMADGTFVISRWGLLRSLEGLAAVSAFLSQVGAA